MMCINPKMIFGTVIILFVTAHLALARPEETGRCEEEQTGITGLPITSDFIEKITGQWNAWSMSVFKQEETTGGGTYYCALDNFCSSCGSFTFAIDPYEDTKCVYVQTFGYFNEKGTLHVEYIVSFASEDQIILKFKVVKVSFNNQDGSVCEVATEEIKVQEITLILIYADESGCELLIFVSTEVYENDEHFVLVLLSEESYSNGSYEKYKQTTTEILQSKSISCSSLQEIELHSLGTECSDSCFPGGGDVKKDVVTKVKEEKYEEEGEEEEVTEKEVKEKEITEEEVTKEEVKEKEVTEEEVTKEEVKEKEATEEEVKEKEVTEEEVTEEEVTEEEVTKEEVTEEEVTEEEVTKEEVTKEEVTKEEVTEEEICSEITPVEKDQEYAVKVTNKWYVYRMMRVTSTEGCSVWGCADDYESVSYTIEMENEQPNKLIWTSYGLSKSTKSCYRLVHRVTTITEKLAVFKNEFIEATKIYEDGTIETTSIDEEQKKIVKHKYAMIYRNDDYSVVVHAIIEIISEKRHCWVAVTETAYNDGSYLQYEEEVNVVLEANGISVTDVVLIEVQPIPDWAIIIQKTEDECESENNDDETEDCHTC